MNKYALISVSDKAGITEFAKGLSDLGYKILGTGNTARVIKECGIECTEISDYTGFPEIFSGRVKTLQPTVFGGILMRRDNAEDVKQAEANKVKPIDIVCVNLYPFPEVVKQKDTDLQTKIENIDIGGPSLIRAAAKNYKHVSVLTKPGQYESFIKELQSNGKVSEDTRVKLAYEAFSYTSYYDTLISDYFQDQFQFEQNFIRLNYPVIKKLRYGENPHQDAYLAGDFNDHFEILHGKEVSYNNIIDLVAAVDLVNELGNNSCVIIKHTNPCGAAKGKGILDAYEKALSCDPVSAFGGIVAFKDEVDAPIAEKLNEIFLEIVCAPLFSDDAFEILKKKKNRRIIKLNEIESGKKLLVRNIPGGVAAQTKDDSKIDTSELQRVTDRKPTDSELENLMFAWIVCKHTKSNAIVYVKDMKAVGVGAGQMSRVDSAKIAAMKAKEHGHDLKGAVAASDAFFPFADGLNEIADNGITSVIQPGGSVRDEEVIKAANEKNISMVFTGIRNFKH